MSEPSETQARSAAAPYKVLTALRRSVEQRPNDFAGRLADILKVASYTTTERIDASHYAFGHVGRAPVYNRDDDVWLEGLLEIGRDDDGMSVRWPVGFLLSPGTKGVAAQMTTVDVVINPVGELVFPMPSRLIVDWRPFADQHDDEPEDEPFGVSDSIGDLMRNARGLKTTTGASRDDLVRMASNVAFLDGRGCGTHVAEDQIRGVVVSRRNSDMIADFISQFTNPDTLRAVLAAVVFHRTVPAGMSPEKADELNGLDRHFILSGRGVLAAIDALQFVHRKLASARKA